MSQTISLHAYHFDGTGAPELRTIDAGTGLVSILQGGVVVFGPVPFTSTPSGLSTSHTFSYVITSPLPTGLAIGAAVARWARSETTQAGESVVIDPVDVPFVVTGQATPLMVGPLKASLLHGDTWIVGDTQPAFSALCVGASGAGVSLVAATSASLHLKRNITAQVLEPFALTIPDQSISANIGTVTRNWASGDLDIAPGIYSYEILVTFSDQKATFAGKTNITVMRAAVVAP